MEIQDLIYKETRKYYIEWQENKKGTFILFLNGIKTKFENNLKEFYNRDFQIIRCFLIENSEGFQSDFFPELSFSNNDHFDKINDILYWLNNELIRVDTVFKSTDFSFMFSAERSDEKTRFEKLTNFHPDFKNIDWGKRVNDLIKLNGLLLDYKNKISHYRTELLVINLILDKEIEQDKKNDYSRIIEPYNKKEKGENVPYKIAMLDEMGILKTLKSRYPIEADIIRITHYLVGGNIDNVKKYYNSIHGSYSGGNQITTKHREHSKQTYYK